MNYKDRSRTLKSLLDGLTEADVRAMSIEALRRWFNLVKHVDWADPEKFIAPYPYTFSLHGDYGRHLIPILVERKKASIDFRDELLKEPFVDDTIEQDWMTPVIEFVWWFCRAGFGQVLQQQVSGYPIRVRVTRRGVGFLLADEDHPLLPGFLDRVRARAPGIPDGVIALLVEARKCLDTSLIRAAIVILGVAYEVAIAEVVRRLDHVGVVDQKKRYPQKPAGEKITGVQAAIRDGKVTYLNSIADPLEAEAAKRAAENAYQFADWLRMRRNDASHLINVDDLDHGGETEELLVSASRNLAGLWSVVRGLPT